MFKVFVVFVLTSVASLLFQNVWGHGMMIEPVGRQSRWRYNSSAPADYNDNELFCGGIGFWTTSDGKCLCGDSYKLPTPRPHELGGLYGEGVIVGKYETGNIISVVVNLTANHRGYFQFDICNVESESESEECFNQNPINISDGNDRYYVPSERADVFKLEIQIPNDLKCEHCVLRWTYTAGNNWGICEDGSKDQGCGPQETFKNCADISIL